MHSRRILLVADRTASGSHVSAAVRARAEEAPTAVTLLVPATPTRGGWTWDEASARGDASRRMHAAADGLRKQGIRVAAVLGDFSPLEAIRDEMRRERYDEIIISTLPTRTSRWLRSDLLTRVTREFSVPVTHVEGRAEPIEMGQAKRSAAA